MKKFSGTKIKYYPADSVKGAKLINKNLSKEFGFKIAADWSKCMKGGHNHNHIRNAHKRMKKCHVCGEPIVKGCEYTDGFSEFQCRSCRIEECREQAYLVVVSFGGCEFKTRRR